MQKPRRQRAVSHQKNLKNNFTENLIAFLQEFLHEILNKKK